MTRRLFDISDDLLALETLLIESGGEVGDEQVEAQIDAYLDDLTHERDTKIDNYIRLVAEQEARAEARKVEARRLLALSGCDEDAAGKLRARLKAFMERHEITKLETPLHRLAVVKNGGACAIDITVASDQIPAPYRMEKTVYQPFTQLIRDTLERGDGLSFARLLPRSTRLTIK